jgi:uncharacterized delta-60 repeat protein
MNDGGIDPSFGNDGIAIMAANEATGHWLHPNVVASLPDGRLLLAGSRDSFESPDLFFRSAMLARMNADGGIDTDFGGDSAHPGVLVFPDIAPGMLAQIVEAMEVGAHGEVFVAGTASVLRGTQGFVKDEFVAGTVGVLQETQGFVVKVGADGIVDSSFGDQGVIRFPGARLHTIGLDASSRVLVAGEKSCGSPVHYCGLVARIHEAGILDASFGSNDGMTIVGGDGEHSHNSYLSSLIVMPDNGVLVGGKYEVEDDIYNKDYDISLARLDQSGHFDASFADGGWRIFTIAPWFSPYEGIDRLLQSSAGDIVVAGRLNGSILLGRFSTDGLVDATFGSWAPGYELLDPVPDIYSERAVGLVEQQDGKLVLAANYDAQMKFLTLRTTDRGELDRTFGDGGVSAPDLGVYSESTGLILQGSNPVVTGMRRKDDSTPYVDLATIRLQADPIFAAAFDGKPVRPISDLSNYDDVAEGFAGSGFRYNGVSYKDVNDVGGVFPSGTTFSAEDVGKNFVIENASLIFRDIPAAGTPPNLLTFGTSFVPGENLSLGPLVRATLDLDEVADSAKASLVFYENGPWGGITLHLEAYRNGILVKNDDLTISNLGGRDNIATTSLEVSGVEFDSLRLRATYNGQPSAPRVMIDNLEIHRGK